MSSTGSPTREQLLEFVRQRGLDRFEEAAAYLQLYWCHGMAHSAIAKATARSAPYVGARIALLAVTEHVQQLVRERRLPLHHAAALEKLGDQNAQIRLAQLAVEEKLSITALRRTIREEQRHRSCRTEDSPQSSPSAMAAR